MWTNCASGTGRGRPGYGWCGCTTRTAVRLVDFGAELKDSSRALRDLERATAAKDRAVGEAIRTWEVAIQRAVELGQPVEDVAAAAGLTVREVRAVLRRS